MEFPSDKRMQLKSNISVCCVDTAPFPYHFALPLPPLCGLRIPEGTTVVVVAVAAGDQLVPWVNDKTVELLHKLIHQPM